MTSDILVNYLCTRGSIMIGNYAEQIKLTTFYYGRKLQARFPKHGYLKIVFQFLIEAPDLPNCQVWRSFPNQTPNKKFRTSFHLSLRKDDQSDAGKKNWIMKAQRSQKYALT